MSSHRLTMPPRWSGEELEEARRAAIARFVQERRGEGVDAYRTRVVQARGTVSELFAETDNLREFDASALISHPEFVTAARFLCAPPVSADDLDSLSGYRVAGRKTRIPLEAAEGAASLLKALFDPVRVPWLAEDRAATDEERRAAIAWTAGVWASELQRTSRRTTASHRQEDAVVAVLRATGFVEASRRRLIRMIDDLDRATFCREAQLDGAKCDVPVRLTDGRLLAVECKVSNSATNSVKRVVRETGGKARAWRNAFGQQVLPAAVLSGVHKLINLLEAQEEYGIAIFWEHDLDALARFLRETVAEVS